MSKSEGNPQNVLPGVNPETDSQELNDTATGPVRRPLAANDVDEEHQHDLNWGDLQGRWE